MNHHITISLPDLNLTACRQPICLPTAGLPLKQIFPEKEYRGPSPNSHIHVSVSELYIPTMGLPFLLEEIGNMWTDPGNI
jgi:hypothetical protein